jgi:hypothetical protein
MGQFLFGLLAGIIVGLVMEWVIDWTGLLPQKRANTHHVEKPRGSTSAAPKVKLAPDETSGVSISNHTSDDAIGE